MWKTALGVKVNLINEEWKVFLTTKRNGDFDIAESGWAMDFPDASNLLDTMASDSQNNDSRYNNPEYDSLIKKAQIEPDRLRRMNYLHEAEKILVDDVPLAPLYFYSAAVMKSPRVKGIYHSPSGIIYFRGTEVD